MQSSNNGPHQNLLAIHPVDVMPDHVSDVPEKRKVSAGNRTVLERSEEYNIIKTLLKVQTMMRCCVLQPNKAFVPSFFDLVIRRAARISFSRDCDRRAYTASSPQQESIFGSDGTHFLFLLSWKLAR